MNNLTILGYHPDNGHCKLTSKNYEFLHIDPDDEYAAIPQHLVLGSLVTVISLPLYCLFRWIAGRRSSPPPKNTIASTPSLISLIMGRADEWLKMEKGRAALDYINFQRMLLFMSLVTLVISVVSFLINFTAGQQSKRSWFFQTIITNLSDNSDYHYFNIISSFLLPWLVVILVRQFMVREKIHSPSYEDSSTLVIEGLDPNIFSDNVIEEYFSTNYPSFQLLKITRAQDTRYLRRKMLLLEWNTSVIKEFLDMKDTSECSCCGIEHSLAAFGRKELEIKKIIQQELRRLRSKTDFLRIVFLTFQTNTEAEKIVLMEKLDHFSNYSTIKQAPRPNNIAWENMRSPVLSIIIKTFCNFIVLMVSWIASSPTAFSNFITDWLVCWFPAMDSVFPWGGIGSSVIIVTAFQLFSQSMPYLVKVSSVKFGPWSKTKLVSNYMVTLFFWLLLTTVLFPALMLSNFYDVLMFFFDFPYIRDVLIMLGGDGDNYNIEASTALSCIYIPSSGSFFVNYLVLSALMRSQMQLHMAGDLLYQLWMVLIYCCTRAERRVACAYAREYCIKRNTGENTSLSEDYVWCVLHFAILMCFFLICPMVSPMFLLYMINKHMVDLQNLRVCYSATVEQPILIRTAAKLVIFCPLLGQVCTTIVYLTSSNQEENSDLLFVSGCLLILNTFMLLLLQSTGWVFPVSVLGDEKNEKRRHLRRGDVYEDPAMYGVLSGY